MVKKVEEEEEQEEGKERENGRGLKGKEEREKGISVVHVKNNKAEKTGQSSRRRK